MCVQEPVLLPLFLKTHSLQVLHESAISERLWAFLAARLVKNPSAVQETLFPFLSNEDLLKRGRLPIPVFLGFPSGSAGKEPSCNEGDLGSNTGLGRSPGEGNGYPLQYSGLENSMDSISMGWQRVRHDWVTCTFTISENLSDKVLVLEVPPH